MDGLQEQFERWALETEGVHPSLFAPHPAPDRAKYLNGIVDGMWRGFKGYHELTQRAEA